MNSSSNSNNNNSKMLKKLNEIYVLSPNCDWALYEFRWLRMFIACWFLLFLCVQNFSTIFFFFYYQLPFMSLLQGIFVILFVPWLFVDRCQMSELNASEKERSKPRNSNPFMMMNDIIWNMHRIMTLWFACMRSHLDSYHSVFVLISIFILITWN